MLVKEYRCGYAASFWLGVMFLVLHLKRNDKDMSIMRLNKGGYNRVSHIVAELRIDRRPNSKKRTCGDAFIRASTIPFDNPAGAMAGARAMKTLTCAFSLGWIASVAKACAVPWEKPIYDRLSCCVVSRM